MQNIPTGTFGNMPISIQPTQPMQQTQIPINQLTPLQIKKKEETYVLSEKIALFYHFIKMNIEVYSLPSSKSTRNMMNLKLDPKMFLSNKGASSLKKFYDDSEEGFFFPSLKIKITDKLIDKYFKHIQTMDKKLLAQNGIDVEQLNYNKDTLRASKIELFTKKSKLAMFLSTVDISFLNKESEESEYLFNKILSQIRWEPIYVILTFFRLFLDYKEMDNLKKNDTFIFLMFLVLQYKTENPDQTNKYHLSFENVYPLIYNFLNTSSFIDEKNKDFINCNPNSYPYQISFDQKKPETFYNSIKDSKFFDKQKLKELFDIRKTSSLREGRQIEANIKKIENEINKLIDFKYLQPISSSFSHSNTEIIKILMINNLHEKVFQKYIKKDSNRIPEKEFTSFLHIRNSIYNDIVKIFDPANETPNLNKLDLLGFPSSKKVNVNTNSDHYNNLFLLPSFPLLAMNFTWFNMEHQNTDENHEVLVEHVLSLFNSHYHFTQNQRDISNIPVTGAPGTITDFWMLYPGYNKPYYVNETDNRNMHYYSNIFLTELEFLVRNTKEIINQAGTRDEISPRLPYKNSVRVTKKIKKTDSATNTTHFTPGILDGFMFIQLPFNSDSANESNIFRFENYSYHTPPGLGHTWSPMIKHSNDQTEFDPNSVATFDNSIHSICKYLNDFYDGKSPLSIDPVLPEAIIQKYKFAQYQLCLNYFYYRNVKVKDTDRFYNNPANDISLSMIFNYHSNNGVQRKDFHNRFNEDANHTYIFHKLVSHKLNENFKIDKSLSFTKKYCKTILKKYLFDENISKNNDNENLNYNLRYTNFYTRFNLQNIVNPMNDDAWFLEHPQFIDISGAPPREPEKRNMYDKLQNVFIKRRNLVGRNPLMTGHTGTHALPAKMDDNIVMQVSYLYSCFKRWSDGNIEDVYNLLYRIIRYGINTNFYHTYNTGEDDGRNSTVEQDINVTDRRGRVIMVNVTINADNTYTTNDNLVDIDTTRLSYNDNNRNEKIRMTHHRNNNYKNFIPNKPNTNEIPNMYDNVGSPDHSRFPTTDARTTTEYPFQPVSDPSYSGFAPYELHPFLIFNYLNPTQSGSGYTEEIAEFTVITWLYCILYHLKNSYLYLLTTFYFMNKTEYVNDFNKISEYYLKTKMYERMLEMDRGNNEFRIDRTFFEKTMIEFVLRNTMKELIMNFIDEHVLEAYYKKKENTKDDYDNKYGLYTEMMNMIKEEDIESKDNMKDMIDKWSDNGNKRIVGRDDMTLIVPSGSGILLNLLINRKSHMINLFHNRINKNENDILLGIDKYYSDEYLLNRLRLYYELDLSEIENIKIDCKKEIENIDYLNKIQDIMKLFDIDKKNDIVKNIISIHEKKMEKCRIIINEELKKKKSEKEETIEKLKNEYLRDEYRKELREKEDKQKENIEKLKELSKNLEISNFFIMNTSFMYKGVHEYINSYITNIKNIFELFRKNIIISGKTDEKEMINFQKIDGLSKMIDEFENKIIKEKNLKVTVQMNDIKNILLRFQNRTDKNEEISMMLKMFDTKQNMEDDNDMTILEIALRDKNEILYHNFYYVLNLLLENNSFVWMDENGMRTATKLLLTSNENKICEQYDFEEDKFMCDLQETRGVINIKIESKFYDEDMDVGFVERVSVARGEICKNAMDGIKDNAIKIIEGIGSNIKYVGKQLGFLDD